MENQREEVSQQFREALAALINQVVPSKDLPGEQQASADSWYVVMISVGMEYHGLRKLVATLNAGWGNVDFVIDNKKVVRVGGGPSDIVPWSDLRGQSPAKKRPA